MFEINMKVSILNESGVYTIRKIENEQFHLEDEHGFTRKIHKSSVCYRKKLTYSTLQNKDSLQDKLHEKGSGKTIKRIDLHLDNLPDKNLQSNHEILMYQLQCFKLFCNEMFRKKVKQFEVVHGHGKGVLRNELRILVQGKNGIEMHDNEFSAGMVGSSLVVFSFSKFEEF